MKTTTKFWLFFHLDVNRAALDGVVGVQRWSSLFRKHSFVNRCFEHKHIGCNEPLRLDIPRCFLLWKPSVIGTVQGMITGLDCIIPGAGVVQSWAAIVYGVVSGSVPWYWMMILHKKSTLLQKGTFSNTKRVIMLVYSARI